MHHFTFWLVHLVSTVVSSSRLFLGSLFYFHVSSRLALLLDFNNQANEWSLLVPI